MQMQNHAIPPLMDELQLEIEFAIAEVFERYKMFLPRSRPAVLLLNPREQFLKEWRNSRAKVEGVRHYRIFSNRTLTELAARDPKTVSELSAIHGIGAKKIESLGHSLLDALANFREKIVRTP